MSVIPMIQERRCRRSASTYEAIFYQLEHVLRLHGLRNFTLSDANGLVLAQAGWDDESQTLAAYAPVLAKCTDRHRRDEVVEEMNTLLELGEDGEESVQARSFFVDGERLFLCLIGEPGAALDACLYRALTGIRRIFREDDRRAS